MHLSNASDNLNTHLSRWLFPKDNQHGWYKAKQGSIEKELWKGKLQAIYNEKLLSAKSVLLGLNLYNVYGNRFFNLFGKILRKLVFNLENMNVRERIYIYPEKLPGNEYLINNIGIWKKWDTKFLVGKKFP